jgi:hypothetical protein
MDRIVILYIVLRGCDTLPNTYRCSDLGFWRCHMLKLLTKLDAMGRECWIFATCAWQNKWLPFRYVFLLWIYSGYLFVDCMKILFFISIFSLLQMTDAGVQHTKWCVFVFISFTVSCFVNQSFIFCDCIYVVMCWTTWVKKLLYRNCLDLSVARGR